MIHFHFKTIRTNIFIFSYPRFYWILYCSLKFTTIFTNFIFSKIAWQHINFYGRYEFSKSPTVVNLDAIIKETDILTRLAQESSLKEKP
ncbi:hypothetical protein CAB88_33140 (plasmid) [Bacillus thuringiensis]|uniref:Uncharacterized protein n=2 Tax=Bacillus thuringiensis TaxID=1428 RepID=A0A1W6WZ23_BACTU|nr:hypothetical protein CAB88_33140 [Bacillus thuringiensis]OTY87353.1 hypothetical protein BK755_14285 [Bacillus thuringiensis serovar aizawai]PQZ67985.1 hypothetical protein CQ064_31405 [Bacillus sp. MYb78]AST05408.1 hypothetical protein BT10792_34195 [Bacillus thuringiensis]OTZ05700.1 hypothetical protein BK756_20640 [Bacillus thuringiensis serovar aizawai]